ncbi:MAG: 2Fe-2S iron-sulfur cluster-binding protein, partial [Hyphomicrobiaceae bacterium]
MPSRRATAVLLSGPVDIFGNVEEADIHIYLRGGSLQLLRLGSGLVLFAFAAAHFVNHSLGLVSLELMHEVQAWRMLVTRSWPGTVLLGASLVVHVGLALVKLAQRRTLRMPLWELLQIAVALAIPFMLLPHVVDTRVGDWGYGINVDYLFELHRLWPAKAAGSIALVLLVWIHSCVGLHYWLRLASGYRRIAPWLLIPAVLIPIAAVAGFVVSGRRTAEILSDPAALAAFKQRVRFPTEADAQAIDAIGRWLKIGFGAVLAIVAASYAYGAIVRRKRALAASASPAGGDEPAPVRISYVEGPSTVATPGMTVLEASRQAGVPHASVCGGRARCATCQVRIVDGAAALPPPAQAEAAVLQATGAPPDLRLACQLRPTAPITVEVLFRPEELQPIPVEFTEVKEVATAHLRAVLAEEHVDMSADDRALLAEWLEGRIAYKVPLADLAAEGFQMQGARIDFLNNRPTVAIAYRAHQHPVTLFVVPKKGDSAVAVSGFKDGC